MYQYNIQYCLDIYIHKIQFQINNLHNKHIDIHNRNEYICKVSNFIMHIEN